MGEGGGWAFPWPGRAVTVEPLRGGARRTLTWDDLPGDCLPLTGPGAKYTVAAKLLGEGRRSLPRTVCFHIPKKKHPEHKTSGCPTRRKKPDHELDLWVLQA